MLKFILILTCFWLVECRFMHPYYGKSYLRHSRKYYYSLNKPPPDFDPIYNYAKDDQRAHFQCPEDELKCSCPFQYRDTAKYECYHDTECPENHKCCPDSCYVHEICKVIVTKTSTESTTTTQRAATEKCTTTTQTEEFTETTSEETTPEITVTKSTTLVTEEETKSTSGSTTTENQRTEEISEVTSLAKTATTPTVLTTTAEITREPIPEPEFVPETTRSESTTKIVSTTEIKRKPTQVPLSEPEVIEPDESGSGTLDNDDDEERDGEISTISTITSEIGTNSDFETISTIGVGTTRKLTESTSSQYGKDLVSNTEKPKTEFVSELTKLESTTEQIEDKRSIVLGTTEVTERPKLEPDIIEASGSGDGTIENDDEDEEKAYTKDSTVQKSTSLAAKTDDNSDDITFDYSDTMTTKDGYNETTVVPISTTRDHTESTSNQHGKDLASDKSTAPQMITTEGAETEESPTFVPITQLESTTQISEVKISTILSTDEIKETQTQEPIPQPEVIEASGSGDGTTDNDDKDEESTTVLTVPGTTGIKEEPTLEPAPQPDVIDGSGSGDGTTSDDEDEGKKDTIEKSTPLPSQTSGNSDDIIFDISDSNFEQITKSDNKTSLTVGTTSATETGTTPKYTESLPKVTKLDVTKLESTKSAIEGKTSTESGTTDIKDKPKMEPIPQPEIIEASGSGDGTTSDDEDKEKEDTKDATIKKSTTLPSQTSGNSDDIIFDFSDNNFEKITKSDNKTRLTVGTTSATEDDTTQKYTESIPKVSKLDITKLESTTSVIEGKTSTEAGTTDKKDKPKVEPIPQPEIIEASGSGDGTTYDDEIPAVSSTIEESTRATIKTDRTSNDIIFDETTTISGGTTVEAVTTQKQSFSTTLTASETTKVPTRISEGTIGTKVPLLTTTLSWRIGQADNGTDMTILPQPEADINRKEVGETAKNQDKEVIDEFSGDNDDEGGDDDEDFGSGALLDTDKSNIAPRNNEIHEEEQKKNTDERTKDERMKQNRLDKRTNEATALDELGGFFVPDYEILD